MIIKHFIYENNSSHGGQRLAAKTTFFNRSKTFNSRCRKTYCTPLVSDIAKVLGEPIDEVAFVLGDPAFFGDDVVASLKELAEGLGAKASIYRQDQPLGTGHAIMCAKDSLDGPANRHLLFQRGRSIKR